MNAPMCRSRTLDAIADRLRSAASPSGGTADEVSSTRRSVLVASARSPMDRGPKRSSGETDYEGEDSGDMRDEWGWRWSMDSPWLTFTAGR